MNNGFIMVTAQYDNMPAWIRSETIESVIDNAEQRNGEQVKLALGLSTMLVVASMCLRLVRRFWIGYVVQNFSL